MDKITSRVKKLMGYGMVNKNLKQNFVMWTILADVILADVEDNLQII